MKFNRLIILVLLLSSDISSAQMFEYLDYLDKEKTSQSTIGEQVNSVYDTVEKKIKDLVLWELNQVKRVQQEIEFEIRDLPPSKALNLKYEKFAELELLIATKEIDLDFWYLEQLDHLNERAEEQDLDCVFLPETQIQGRIVKMVIKHLMVDDKKYNDYKEKLDYTLTAAGFVGGVATGVIVEIGSIAISTVTDKAIEEVMSNYSKYFSLGMMTHAREVQLEKIKNAKS